MSRTDSAVFHPSPRQERSPASASVVSGVFSSLQDILENHLHSPTTGRPRDLLEIVHAEPGLNLQELADRLNMQRTPTKHHVRRLLGMNLISTMRQRRHVLHFTKWMNPEEKTALALLRIGSVRTIVRAAVVEHAIDTASLAKQLEMSPATMRTSLRLLEQKDLIQLIKVNGIRARQVHLSPVLRLTWARWFDPLRSDTDCTSIQDKPSKLAGLFVLLFPWLWSWSA